MGDPVTVAAISSAVSAVQQHAQARAQAKTQHAAAEQDLARRREVQTQQEKQQRAQSKQQQASARAAFGARGLSSGAGSANAVIDGIAQQSENAIADDRRLFDLDLATLRANQAANRRQNLLQTRNSLFNTVVNTGGKAFQNADLLKADDG